MTAGFFQTTRAINAATHWISLVTGEQIKFTKSDKMLWVWMYDRYNFFNDKGNPWFDNQSDIAEMNGCEVSTVKRFLKKLTEHGYLVTSKKKLYGAAVSNSYVITQDIVLAARATKGTIPCPTSPTKITKPTEAPRAPVIELPSRPVPEHTLVPWTSEDYDDVPEWDRQCA